MNNSPSLETHGPTDEEPIFVQVLKTYINKDDGNVKRVALPEAIVLLHEATGCLDITQHPQIVNALDGEQGMGRAIDAMKETLSRLPSMSAEHESHIMIQHGLFLHYHQIQHKLDHHTGILERVAVPMPVVSPPCSRGELCIGNTGHFIGFTKDVPGVILMAFIHASELSRLRSTGERPIDWHKRACVLCVRHLLTAVMITQMTLEVPIPNGVYIQPWCSQSGVPGSYRLDSVWTPAGETCASGDGYSPQNNGLVGVFPKFEAASLVAIPPSNAARSASSKLWSICQAGMIIPKYQTY